MASQAGGPGIDHNFVASALWAEARDEESVWGHSLATKFTSNFTVTDTKQEAELPTTKGKDMFCSDTG